MSDFDKEAERERLREKYERDKQKREVTEQMSELLLQGATMTNAHCQDCGDPIFRYDGQEFCPTCEKAVDRGEATENGDGEATDGDAEPAEAENGASETVEVAAPEDDARVQFGGSAEDESDDPAEQSDATVEQAHPQQSGAESNRRVPSLEPGEGGDLAGAQAALAATVQRLAQEAGTAEDPRRAKELLEAAREGSEALAALRQ